MKLGDLCREVVVEGKKLQVALGDSVFWWPNAVVTEPMQVATVTAIGEDGLVDLIVFSGYDQSARMTRYAGCRLYGDPALQTNDFVRQKGCWAPRGVYKFMNLRD